MVNTTLARFERNEFSVVRRYRDFCVLYSLLTHTYPGVIVPPIPEKLVMGKTTK